MSPKHLDAPLNLAGCTNDVARRALVSPRFAALLPLVCAFILAATETNAQTAVPPPPTTPPPVDTAAAAPPPPAAPPPVEALPAVPPPATAAPAEVPKTQAEGAPNPLDTPPPLTPNEAMPSTAKEEKLPAINVAAWLRMGARIQSGSDPNKLNDLNMDTVYAELHAGGKIHKNVSVTLNLNANGLGKTAGIEDAIIGWDPMDEFHVWFGQMLVPIDRANYSGPFFATPWNYTGALGAATFIPHEGPSGRNAGLTLWGDVAGGHFKYAAGVFDNGDINTSPLYSGRISVPFIGAESGYFGNASYFGDKDIVALGVGGQYQHKGSVGTAPDDTTPAPTADFGAVTADLLGEFKYGDSGGFFSGDAGYYHYAGTYENVKDAFYIMASVATPKVGVGNLQPLVRFQYAKGDGDFKGNSIDAGLNYLIKGPALRIMTNFQHATIDSGTGTSASANMVQLGAQAIFF